MSARLHPGSLAALGLAGLVAASLSALLLAAQDGAGEISTVGAGFSPYIRRVVVFALSQAAVSTGLALVLGTALALALARRSFPGKDVVLAALATAAVLPAIVLVFAVVAVYGRAGWAASLLAAAGLPGPGPLYGWPGILLAHTVLNVPLVARVLLDRLATVPAEQWRLAHTLRFSPLDVFRHIDAPILRAEIPGLAALVFLLCFTSFPIVLALGGGPGRATLEVAIFEALRLDLDFARAAILSFVQIALCSLPVLVLALTERRAPAATTAKLAAERADRGSRTLRWLDVLVLGLSTLLILPPLAAVAAGLPSVPAILDRDLAAAALTSLFLALAAALIACLLALALAGAARQARRRGGPRAAALYDALPTALLAVPPFALTAGLFIILRPLTDPATVGLVLLPLLNAATALPFVYRFVAPALTLAGERYGRLSSALGISGVDRLRIVDWPLLRRPLAAAFAMAMALSFGDFGIIALFGGTLRTLPYLLHERLGAYRVEEAGGVALVLTAICLVLAYAALRGSHARP